MGWRNPTDRWGKSASLVLGGGGIRIQLCESRAWEVGEIRIHRSRFRCSSLGIIGIKRERVVIGPSDIPLRPPYYFAVSHASTPRNQKKKQKPKKKKKKRVSSPARTRAGRLD